MQGMGIRAVASCPLNHDTAGALQESPRRHLLQRTLKDFWIPGPPLLGALFGLFMPLPDDTEGVPQNVRRVSAALGWSYFCAWSISFYPQVVQNFKRRSVIGLSVEFQLLNFAGFICYFAFNACLYWIGSVQQEYRHSHGGNSSAVRLNDVVFAGHAAMITLVTLLQIAVYYDYPPPNQADRTLRRVVVFGLVGVSVVGLALAVAICASSERLMNWLSYLLLLSGVKVAISTFKYCPQVWLNWRRRSTDGWNIANVLLDFTGGCLSVAQLLLDAWASQDWSAITGDPAKLLLGNLSMVFDVVFMVQHYCLYPDSQGSRTLPI